MSSGFLSDASPEAPAAIIAQAQDLPSPRVAIARAGAPLPMKAAKGWGRSALCQVHRQTCASPTT